MRSYKLATIDLKNTIKKGLYQIGKELKEEAKRSFDYTKHGKFYTIKGKTYQASAPFEPLASLSGETKESIYSKMEGSNLLRFGGSTKQLYIWQTKKDALRPTLDNAINKVIYKGANRFRI